MRIQGPSPRGASYPEADPPSDGSLQAQGHPDSDLLVPRVDRGMAGTAQPVYPGNLVQDAVF